jgi:hypothetical protein
MLKAPDMFSRRHGPNLVRLGPLDRARVLDHFLALDGDARLLRFGMSYSDDAVRRYVQRLNFEGDLLLGWTNHFRELVGVVHLARIDDHAVEFSINMARSWRGLGHGQDVTELALAEAARHGLSTGARAVHAVQSADGRHHGPLRRPAARAAPSTWSRCRCRLLSRPLRAQLGPFIPSTLAFA